VGRNESVPWSRATGKDNRRLGYLKIVNSGTTADRLLAAPVLREMEAEGIELPSSIAAARLLILTGCRLGEILTLQWEHVDIAGKALRLPDSKTGAKIVHLGQPAVEVLEKIEHVDGNPWGFLGPCPARGSLTHSRSGSASAHAPVSRTSASMTCGIRSRRPPSHQGRDCR
jgi:integrase